MIRTTAGNSFWRMLMHYMAGIAVALGLMQVAQAQAVEVKVTTDRASLVSVAGKPAAIVIGNPLFTEVAVVAGNKLLVQGRNPGRTNVIVLDVDGNRLAEFDVVVSSRGKDEIALYNGGARLTYSCSPDCSRVLNVDDAAKAVDEVNRNISTRNGLIMSSTNQ